VWTAEASRCLDLVDVLNAVGFRSPDDGVKVALQIGTAAVELDVEAEVVLGPRIACFQNRRARQTYNVASFVGGYYLREHPMTTFVTVFQTAYSSSLAVAT